MIISYDKPTKPQEAQVNIFSKLPFFNSKNEEEFVTSADDEVQAKKDRIAFHRNHVRNGPTNFKSVSSGQERRANKRALNRRTKRARRSQIKMYFETQRLAASVRGHLQLAGALPFVVPTELNPYFQVSSTAWIVQRFGAELEDGTVSFDRDDVLVALGQALHYYGQATGQPGLQLPDDYIVPVYWLSSDSTSSPVIVDEAVTYGAAL